jgi:hypothetical protein
MSADATPALKRYVAVTFAAMGVYAAMNVAAIAGVLDGLPRPALIAFAVLVTIPVAVQIWATIVAMRDSDEYVRAVMAKRFIVAAGAAFAIAAAWGFAESFADAPHLPAWLVYPLFWGLYGVVTPLVRDSR